MKPCRSFFLPLILAALLIAGCSPLPSRMPVITLTSRPTILPATPRVETPTFPAPPVRPAGNQPTAVPLPTVVPSLADVGPWLMLERSRVGAGEDGSGKITDYFITDADGTNLQAANLPNLPENRSWVVKPTPRGRLLAFRQTSAAGDPADPAYILPGLADDVVWIVKLPENRVVRKMALLSDAAWTQIAETQDQLKSLNQAPLALGLITGPDSFVWSPDGRYLAFSAALDGPNADVYLYDAENDAINRLTETEAGAQPWFWSADGKWLVYRTCKSYGSGLLVGMQDFTGVYSLPPDDPTKVKKLYLSQAAERVERITVRSFYVYDFLFEGSLKNLRKVDLATGQTSYFYPGKFTDLSVNPDGLVLLYFQNGGPGSQFGLDTGIYQLDTATWNLTPLIAGTYHFLHWDADWKVFLALHPLADNQLVNETVAFRVDVQGQMVGIPEAQLLVHSPDGQWAVGRVANPGSLLQLLPKSGPPLTLDQPGGRISWLPDSSGLYALNCASTAERTCVLTRYRRDTAWKPEPLPLSLPGAADHPLLEDYTILGP